MGFFPHKLLGGGLELIRWVDVFLRKLLPAARFRSQAVEFH